MRIITGRARGTKLFSLDGDTTRPTADRTKEAMFSMLQFMMEGREVLDLFGGSGQLALEAVSRGAAHAVVCDVSDAACEVIRRNIVKTHSEKEVTLIHADFRQALDRLPAGSKFDIVFLDPPYNKGLVASALAEIHRRGLLKPTSVVACESGGEDILTPVAGDYEVVKSSRYGMAQVTILRPIVVTNQ